MSDKFFPRVFELTEELQENDLGLEFVRLRGRLIEVVATVNRGLGFNHIHLLGP